MKTPTAQRVSCVPLAESSGIIRENPHPFVFILVLTIPSDIADAFPNGECREYFRSDFLTAMTRETRSNADFLPRTRDTARWAREQIKRQTGTFSLGGNFFTPSLTGPTTPVLTNGVGPHPSTFYH